MSGAPPAIPSNLQIYNSYVEDPKWQRKFTIIWCSALALSIAISVPSLIRSLRNGRALKGFFGISEDLRRRGYMGMTPEDKHPRPQRCHNVSRIWYSVISVSRWSLPYVELNAGQIFTLASYLVVLLVCIIKDAPLISNPNRAGFLALAQLPIVFLFATKNSLFSLLLGPGNGYEKLNFLHRMAGRLMFLAAGIHGSLWIRNHLEFSLPILGPQKETSGVASFSLLCAIVLSSLRPVRRLFYGMFFFVHVLTFVAFFVTVCYHTMYASPWIFPPLAFYGADMLMRMLRYRIKDATLVAQDKFLTTIRVNDCDDGWSAGQHVQLRVFFSGRMLESHPLTILSALPSYSCLTNPGLILGARVNGDWTRALNDFARKEQERLHAQDKDAKSTAAVPVHVMLDGPYGGPSVDLGEFESALLVAGGSGITFTLGLLDDIVGRCVKLGRRGGERTRRIEFSWCIRSFGHIQWFSPMLMDIANVAEGSSIDLRISIFVTCLCDPDAIPPIPNCVVILQRPSIYNLLCELIAPSSSSSVESVEDQGEKMERSEWVCRGGSVAVCASGPESLTAEAQNAVARLGVVRGLELGGVAVHVERFAL